MEKNSFYVIEEKETATGKYISYPQKVGNACNLLAVFKPRRGMEIVSINACDTWREAQEVADYWNEGAKNRGLYLFA